MPGVLSAVVFITGAIAFWPGYLTLLVLALRTGKLKYFAFLGMANILASIYWLYVTVISMSA
jgi:hypothetical protein